MNALAFLYKRVLKHAMGGRIDAVRANWLCACLPGIRATTYCRTQASIISWS